MTVRNAISEWMNGTVKRKQVVPAYLMLAVGAVLGVYSLDRLGEQRIADATTLQCVNRVDTRETLRGVLLGITAQFPQDDPGVLAVVALIENDYPPLTIEEHC